MAAPTSNKHKPSGCKHPSPPSSARERPLTRAVPEPATKQRKTLAERATEYDRKPAAPPNARPAPAGVKGTVARGLAASTSRIGLNKYSRPQQHSASTNGYGVGNAARIPSGPSANPRPKSAFGHARSKSHNQGMRPATAMQHHEEDAEDDGLERKGLQPFPIPTIPTIPKDTLKVQKKAPPAPRQRPISLNVPPKRAFPLSTSRAVSSPSNFRSITPVIEKPTDESCDDICNTLGSLSLGAFKAVHRDSRVGRGTISGKEQNLSLRPVKSSSQLPRATPGRQQATPTPARPPSITPRTQAPFINRFTNDRCPDFYDDRVEAIERDFRAFREQMLTDMQKTTDYKDTIQQLQSKGVLHSGCHSAKAQYEHASATNTL